MLMRFTEEELRIAKSVDLCAVASHLGYTVRRIGKYHTLKEMDSSGSITGHIGSDGPEGMKKERMEEARLIFYGYLQEWM